MPTTAASNPLKAKNANPYPAMATPTMLEKRNLDIAAAIPNAISSIPSHAMTRAVASSRPRCSVVNFP